MYCLSETAEEQEARKAQIEIQKDEEIAKIMAYSVEDFNFYLKVYFLYDLNLLLMLLFQG